MRKEYCGRGGMKPVDPIPPRPLQAPVPNYEIPCPPPPNDPVNPTHYKTGKIECIEAIESATEGLTGVVAYSVGCCIKYLYRFDKKNKKEDLFKCRWYLDKIIEKYQE